MIDVLFFTRKSANYMLILKVFFHFVKIWLRKTESLIQIKTFTFASFDINGCTWISEWQEFQSKVPVCNLTLTLNLIHLIPSWLFLAEIKCTVHIALSKWLAYWFQPVWQSRQQALKAYCPNIYTYRDITQ